jgi:hypothetical protein
MKKNYFHIVGIALLISFLALIVGFAPFASSLKNQIATTFNGVRYGKDIKNFGSSDIITGDTINYKNFKDCGYNVKAANKYKEAVLPAVENSTNTNPVLTLKLGDKTEQDNPDIQIMCLQMNDIIAKFKENVVAAWKDKPELDQQFGMTADQASKLSVRDFYKLYTQKVTTACKSETNYTDVVFINNDLVTNFIKEYNHCRYEFPTLNLVKEEFYFFPVDETKPILFVRTVNHDVVKKDFLIIKNQ